MTKETYDEINALQRRIMYLVNSNLGKFPKHLRQTYYLIRFNEEDFQDVADKPYRPDQQDI